VSGIALGAVGATKIASDYDADGDSRGQPDRDMAGGDPIAVPMSAPRAMPSPICVEDFFISVCLQEKIPRGLKSASE
jgi:hypothetical protein